MGIPQSLSWAVGVVFGRFNDIVDGEAEDFSPFNELPANSPGTLISRDNETASSKGVLVEDVGHKYDLVKAVNEVLKKHKINAKTNLREWLRKDFFSIHLKWYTKSRRAAPLYWPIQVPSYQFNIWLYFHKLSSQSLLTCVNEFIQPKLDDLSNELSLLKSNSVRGKKEETKIDEILSLTEELEIIKIELIRISKFWQPNINDGVQITAAPLWRLFQHKAWQKKLKQTWEKLENGEYDWAHLAFSIWPERVLQKCHEDRSLAIAHDVEDDLWHEVEVIKGRKKEPVWEWQPKPLSESELRAYIKEKIVTDDRLKLYRSNQPNNANGGAW